MWCSNIGTKLEICEYSALKSKKKSYISRAELLAWFNIHVRSRAAARGLDASFLTLRFEKKNLKKKLNKKMLLKPGPI